MLDGCQIMSTVLFLNFACNTSSRFLIDISTQKMKFGSQIFELF